MEKVAKAGEGDALSREEALVAAADQGLWPFLQKAGFARLAAILLGTAALALFAQARLARQDYLIGSLAAFGAIFVLTMIPSATPWRVRERARKEARGLRRLAARLLERHKARLAPPAVAEVEEALAQVDAALAGPAAAPTLPARAALDAALDKHLSFARKSSTREYVESVGGAILVALLLRAFVFEPFHIPSGSMIPTLLVGDFIFVNKMSYGLRIPFTDPAKVHKLWEGAPKRGDVVVFMIPKSPEVDYVKRVVGLPGDRIKVRDNQVWVNGEPQPRTEVGDFSYTERSEFTQIEFKATAREFTEVLGGQPHRTIVRKERLGLEGGFSREGEWVVGPGRVFVMGDNRDNSADSRVEGGIGEIPFSYIKGRASVIWISFGGPYGVRGERFFQLVH